MIFSFATSGTTPLCMLAAVAVSMTASVVGTQTRRAYSIAAFANKEGGQQSFYFGSLPRARYQLIEGSLKGQGAKTITELSFRADGALILPFSFERSWTKVELRVAESDFDRFSEYFDSNNKTPWVTVFSQPMKWPAIGPNPNPGQPRTWGAEVTFPFATPWTYSGQQDLLLDFRFDGGTMPRNARWSRPEIVPYDLDGVGFGGTVIGPYTTMGLTTCRHTGFIDQPYMWAYASVYPKGPTPKALAGKMSLELNGTSTAPNAPVIAMLGISGSIGGWVLPGICQRLYVDLRQPALMLPAIANNIGASDIYLSPLPYTLSMVGLNLWSQGIFVDAGTNALSLTRAGFATLPPQQTNSYRRAVTWNHVPAARRGTPVDPSCRFSPLFQIQYR